MRHYQERLIELEKGFAKSRKAVEEQLERLGRDCSARENLDPKVVKLLLDAAVAFARVLKEEAAFYLKLDKTPDEGDRPALPDNPGPVALASSPAGLGIPLTPAQRFILGLIAESRGYPELSLILDDETASRDFKRLLGSEQGEARLWLPADAKTVSDAGRTRIQFDSPITRLLCVAGRRSGKTTIAAALMAWLARKILRDSTFLEGVPVLPDSLVSILNVACDIHQSAILFRTLTGFLSRLRLIPDGASRAERMQIGRLLIESLSSSSRSSRGRTACGLCLDEFAHFQRTGGPLADRAVWTALMPSLATFGPKGLAVVTTSPAGRSGVVWDLFSMRGQNRGTLTVQLPTWEMNPNIARESLEEEFVRDENLARQEYGAEFLAPHGRFLRLEEIQACVTTIDHPPPGRARRHIHVDLGFQHDATAIALGYIDRSDSGDENDWRVVIERVEVMLPPPGGSLNVGEVEKRIVDIARESGAAAITFDQHQSAYLVERLRSAGFDAEVFPATAKSNRDVFSFLSHLISTRRIVLPQNQRLLDELATLECTPTESGFRVEAPSGGSDDCADAVAVCAWRLARDQSPGWVDLFDITEMR